MDADFSEFSFGYAAIREAESTLTAVYGAAGAPVLPSLQLEEKRGWDAKVPTLDYALFMQFKRPTFVSRRHPSSPTWDQVGNPHYRVAIHTGEHQHQRLLELENELSSDALAANVYYVAPRFHLQADFDAAYLNGSVLDRSVIEPPSEFGDDGTVHHHVTDATTLASQVLSEPRPPIKQTEWARVLEDTSTRARHRGQRSDRPELPALEQTLLRATAGLERVSSRDLDAPVTRRIDRLATLLGCGLVLFGSLDD